MRRPVLVVLGSLLLVPACADEGPDAHESFATSAKDERPSGGAPLRVLVANGGGTREANEALGALARDSGSRWTATRSPRGGIAFLSGRLPNARAQGEPVEDAARRFLRERATLTKIADGELAFAGERQADGGDVVASFDRTIDGRRVIGGAVDVRFDASGALVGLTSGGWPDEPRVERAAKTEGDVRSALGAGVESVEPVWFGSMPALLVVASGPSDDAPRRQIVVDARDGSIVVARELADHAYATVTMRDAIGRMRGVEVETTDANGGTMWSHDGSARHYASWCNGTTTCNLVGTPLSSAFPSPVVSAMANVRATRDAWLLTWGRSGVDGGDGKVLSYVHHGAASEQAQWSSRGGRYGIAGVLTFFVPGKEEYSTAGAIDLVGHEYTHGVVSYTLGLASESAPAGLALAFREAKAINESLADVFGIYAKKFACDRGYLTGCGVLFHYDEMAFMRPYYVRDIADPAKPAGYSGPGAPQHDHYDGFLAASAEEHFDAGVATKAWYLAARGGKHPRSKIGPRAGIGTKDAWDIWYAAAFAPNQRAPFLSFHDLAVRTIDAARAKYGDGTWRYRAVACAWRAVGVGSDWGQCDPCPKPKAERGVKTASLGIRTSGGGEACATVASFRDAPSLEDGKATCGAVTKGGATWTRIDAVAGKRIDLNVIGATGDVDLQAFDASGRVVARSEQLGDASEWLELVPESDGPLFVRVEGRESATFDLRLGDELDPTEPDDSCELPQRPSCAVQGDDACGSGVCSRYGEGFCCRAPAPVTKPCLGDAECGPNEVCAQVQASPDGDGLSFSCVPAGTDACTD